MTANPLRAARGTTTSLETRVLLDGELAYNTTTERLHVGDGVTLGGVEVGGLSDLVYGRPEWYVTDDDWGAAITACAAEYNYVKLSPGTTYTWDDSQVAIDKNNFILDCRGAVIQPKYASDYAFKFGNGSTQRQNNFILGGQWNQRSVADGGAAQGLFDIRGHRNFGILWCQGVNIYQIYRWGAPADSSASFKLYHVGCDWGGRTNANGGHTHMMLADGSSGGYYESDTFIEADAANLAASVSIFRLTSAQGPARFDHLVRRGGNWKGADYGLHCVDARIVNVDIDPSARVDDTQGYGYYIEATGSATKGGCEDIHIRGAVHGLGPGGVIYVKDAKGGLGFSDILLDGVVNNNATGGVAKFETSGSGAISNVHIENLHIANYNPSDANQDAIVIDGDVDEVSLNVVHLDGKPGATYLARRVIFDNTAATKKVYIGPNIAGNVNTDVVTQTNAGTLVGRHNWMRANGAPKGVWASASDVVFGRVTASAGPAEEITFTDQAQALADDTSFRAMCATLGTWHVFQQSSVAVTHTGDTSETTLATITLPGGAMGANGRVRITTIWSANNDASNKTLRVKFGGTNYFAQNITTQQGWRHQNEIGNRNSASSQIGNQNNAFGSLSAAPTTSAVDTTSDVTILLTGQLADGADSVTLESYVVEVFYAA